MEPQPLEEVVRNVDMRLTRVEQILPTLATKAELQEAIAPLATKEELRVAIAEAIAPLATKVELREAIAEAIAPLATRAELQEFDPNFGRRCVTKVSAPGDTSTWWPNASRATSALIAEGQVLLQERFEDLRTDLKADIAQLDRRVMRLEAAR